MKSTQWLIRGPSHGPRLRLYCFAHAGGNATNFMRWQHVVHPAIEICGVQLPGRGARYAEIPFTSFQELIKAVAGILRCQDDVPFAFFGHSLGCLIAFELARYCQKHGLRKPVHLFASGCSAPRHRRGSERLHNLGDDQLIEALKGYDGTPPDVLENRDLMKLLLPTIRADFALASEYEYSATAPLELSLTVMAGRLDRHMNLECVNGWADEVTGAVDVHWFDGGHFFLESQNEDFLSRLSSKLNELVFRA